MHRFTGSRVEIATRIIYIIYNYIILKTNRSIHFAVLIYIAHNIVLPGCAHNICSTPGLLQGCSPLTLVGAVSSQHLNNWDEIWWGPVDLSYVHQQMLGISWIIWYIWYKCLLLIGGWALPLWKMMEWVTVGIILPNYMENIIQSCSKAPDHHHIHIFLLVYKVYSL